MAAFSARRLVWSDTSLIRPITSLIWTTLFCKSCAFALEWFEDSKIVLNELSSKSAVLFRELIFVAV